MASTLLLIVSFLGLAAAADWSYTGSNGPSFWQNNYPDCGLQKQSPVDIGSGVSYDSSLGAFSFQRYDSVPAGTKWSMSNNGHSATISISGGNAPTVSGGGLPATYTLEQFHFHWGSSSSQGSEHTVSGKRYPMEVHMVHYDAVKHGDFATAADKDQGLAVLGFFFEISDKNNDAYTDIINTLKSIAYEGNEASVTPRAINELIAADMDNFWRYSGSLTTPACYESIVWTVVRQPIPISEAQMAEFRALYQDPEGTSNNQRLVDNFRPIQPLNSREITSSFTPSDYNSAGAPIAHKIVFLLAAILPFLLM